MRTSALLSFFLALLPAAVRGEEAPVQSPGLTSWAGRADAGQGLVFDSMGLPPFDRAVLSWNATGPATFVLEVDGRRHVMGHWSDQPRSETTAFVDEDTLKLPSPATAFKMIVLPSTGTTVTRLTATYWRAGARQALAPALPAALGTLVAGVPHYVQRDNKTCSPTSVAMVLGYYGFTVSPDTAANGVRDHDLAASEVFGNWPFNTAYAHKAGGGALATYVRRMSSMAELEQELVAGRPVIVSSKPHGSGGQGHLVVVIGFTVSGDVVINDPGRGDGAGRVIPRAVFYQSWLQDASGIAYIILRP